MHLAQRAYVLLLLTAVLALAGVWSSNEGLADLWCLPAGLLLLGLAIEGWTLRKAQIEVGVETATRAYLGHPQPAAFVFRNAGPRSVAIEYAPVVPGGVEPLGMEPRTLEASGRGLERDPFVLLPIRLGPQRWPVISARLLGKLGLAWWSRVYDPGTRIAVAPDVLSAVRARPRGQQAGARPRRIVGAGSELYQLRGYVHGDPPARIDWKATARLRSLVTREFSEDQHLDLLVAIDAGRYSRVRAGKLDRFGLYANLTARLAEVVVPNDDRIGLLVFAERPVAMCPPGRGQAAIMRIRATLEGLAVTDSESDPLAAATCIRGMLRHRSLIVMLTDLGDTTAAEPLARAVRLLSPPHLVLLAGVRSQDIPGLANRAARQWLDPWIALAAQEHEERAEAQRLTLRRLGAQVVAVDEELLERSVLSRYETLRRSRRV